MIDITNVKEIEPNKLINAMAKLMKEENIIQMPEWAKFVKTGTGKERPPENEDWWYLRSASMLRRIYLNGPIGTERLRTCYGSRKSHGVVPHHFSKAGGKIIRTILQQLEKAEMIKPSETKKKGRVVSPKGQKFINRLAKQVSKQSNETPLK